MVCPRCGREGLAKAGRCPACGAPLVKDPIAAATIAIDTTGLPPGATFGPTLDLGSKPSAAPTPLDAAIGAIDGTGVTGEAQTVRPVGGPLGIGQAFSARYHIIKLLGAGGMGAVYQAWDAELEVAVALKVILVDPRQGTVSSELEKRFKNELLLARQVTHKNVVRIHDLGEIDSIKYITMPYVQGDDLTTLLRREGKLPITRALRLARQIADGLEAAHEAGVVHRDLKPPNIMIGEDDLALIMDFGISASAAEATSGGVIGTLEYMAPEQGVGKPVDARADIYAFGLILYEMLIGLRPATATTGLNRVEAMKRRFEQGVPPVRTIDESIPEPLAAVVARCLEKDPAARYQTTSELCAALGALDDSGELIPIRRVVGLPLAAAVGLLLVVVGSGAFWYFRPGPPPAQHEPVSVLIADFENSTNDATFDRTVESTMKLALEGAGFISAYDRGGMRTLGVRPPEKLDGRAAQEIAVKQGVGVVVSGSLERRGTGYGMSVTATQAVTGKVMTSAKATADDKEHVLGMATTLATKVRKALGDNTSDSAQRFAMDTLTSASLDAVHDYALGQEALSNNQNDEAIRNYLKAVARDPNFGAAYTGLANASVNIGQQEDGEKYIKEAIRHLDSVTERERYRTRGLFYRVTNDYQKCVKEYSDLVAKYAADAAAHNNVALCVSNLRDMPKARDEMRRVVAILPKRALYRLNLALYTAYGSDFEAAEPEARQAQELGAPLGWLAVAFTQLGRNQLPEAAESYQKLAEVGPLYASWAASGLADLAMYEGRFADAARLLEEGAAADLTANYGDRAAAKYAALAHTQLLRQQRGPAIKAAESALANSNAMKIRFLAAQVFVEAGEIPKAEKLAAGLASQLPPEPQALAKIIQGEAAMKQRDTSRAIKAFMDANALLDTWIGRFDLGRAFLEAQSFIEADSEFDKCIKRRGEALSLFLDEAPTYGYLPPVYYYQGRVREGLKTEKFAESYRTYLSIREKAGEDPLLREVRRRAGL